MEAEVQAAVQEVSVGSEIVMDSGVAGCAGVYITKSCGSAGVSIPGGAPLLGDEACDMSGDATFAKAFSEGLVFLAPLPVLAPLRNLLLDGWEVLWRLWSASFFGGLSWRQCGSYWWMVSFFPDVGLGSVVCRTLVVPLQLTLHVLLNGRTTFGGHAKVRSHLRASPPKSHGNRVHGLGHPIPWTTSPPAQCLLHWHLSSLTMVQI